MNTTAEARTSRPPTASVTRGWTKVKDLLQQSLSDIRVVKYGPGSNGKLSEDQGAYVMLIVGRTADDKLAGVTFNTVDT